MPPKRAPSKRKATAAPPSADTDTKEPEVVHETRRDPHMPTECAFGFQVVDRPNLKDAQTIAEFVSDEDRNAPSSDRNTIVLVNFGNALSDDSMAIVGGWIEAFYLGMKVRWQHVPLRQVKRKFVATIDAGECDVATRKCPDGLFNVQLSISDLNDVIIAMIPPDAFCVCGVTSLDTFEAPEDEFICGRAYGGSRCAVVSSARYAANLTPRTIAEAAVGDVSDDIVTAHRVASTVAHELGHCFGLDHCVHYNCAMRESCSLQDDLTSCLDLCPLDAHKLHLSLKCDLAARRQAMLRWLQDKGGPLRILHAHWLQSRCSHLQSCHNPLCTRRRTTARRSRSKDGSR